MAQANLNSVQSSLVRLFTAGTMTGMAKASSWIDFSRTAIPRHSRPSCTGMGRWCLQCVADPD